MFVMFVIFYQKPHFYPPKATFATFNFVIFCLNFVIFLSNFVIY